MQKKKPLADTSAGSYILEEITKRDEENPNPKERNKLLHPLHSNPAGASTQGGWKPIVHSK